MTLYNTDPFQPVLYINRLSTFQVRPTAEAACSHVVELARVEVAANPGADARLRNFASIRLADAELAVHNQFKRLAWFEFTSRSAQHGNSWNETVPPYPFLVLGQVPPRNWAVCEAALWLLEHGQDEVSFVGILGPLPDALSSS